MRKENILDDSHIPHLPTIPLLPQEVQAQILNKEQRKSIFGKKNKQTKFILSDERMREVKKSFRIGKYV